MNTLMELIGIFSGGINAFLGGAATFLFVKITNRSELKKLRRYIYHASNDLLYYRDLEKAHIENFSLYSDEKVDRKLKSEATIFGDHKRSPSGKLPPSVLEKFIDKYESEVKPPKTQ